MEQCSYPLRHNVADCLHTRVPAHSFKSIKKLQIRGVQNAFRNLCLIKFLDPLLHRTAVQQPQHLGAVASLELALWQMHIPPLTHNLGDVTDRVFSGAPDSIQEVTCSRTGLNLSTGFHNETSWELRPWELLSILLLCRRETKVL